MKRMDFVTGLFLQRKNNLGKEKIDKSGTF